MMHDDGSGRLFGLQLELLIGVDGVCMFAYETFHQGLFVFHIACGNLAPCPLRYGIDFRRMCRVCANLLATGGPLCREEDKVAG